MNHITSKTAKIVAVAALASLTLPLSILTGCSSSPTVVATASNTATQNQPAPEPVDNNDVAGSADGVSVSEQEVSDYISQYRTYIGASDDVSFATLLDQAGQTPEDIRNEAIEMLLAQKLVHKKAEENNIEVSADELDAYIKDVKAGMGYASDDMGWKRTLGTSGYDNEEKYRFDIETKMLLEKLVAAENPNMETTEVQMLVLANSNVKSYTGEYVVETIFSAGHGSAASSLASQAEGTSIEEFEELSQQAVESGKAEEVIETGWSCLSNLDSALVEELSKANAGDVVMAQADDGSYHVMYVKEVFVPTSVGTIDFANMPQDIRARLASDASKQNRANLTNNYLSTLKDNMTVQYSSMPDDAPYNVDMTLSTYGEDDTLSEDELQSTVQEGISAIENASN